jgi:5-methylcytosine-specific restriction enzyme subunit McrC
LAPRRNGDLDPRRSLLALAGGLPLLMTRRPRLVCDFEDLDQNVLANQILRTTLARLAKADSLDRGLRVELLAVDKQFWAIDHIRLSRSAFRRVQAVRNNPNQAFLMKVCELAFLTTLPNEEVGGYRFADILRDEDRMPLVFQAFVRNFYALEQEAFKVGAVRIPWDAVPEDEHSAALLPGMNTDIVLASPER